ncbi:MAG: hypothetical protein AVDCRST_MAG64-801 [uncultured Phycisphaerae bacterium]|uniref:DUF2029 domain-containing protein n=1 Tax=uncultured Phycisphaerae bacterium TaxID=904963 RepID=A0A6J4NB43_9BACT|nr:MAG: hypothetical protein AVDCRST_MAG64-801 [uncultured Phycisphaerae bacterium]
MSTLDLPLPDVDRPTDAERFTDAGRAVLLTLAALSVGLAIHVRDGEYWDSAIRWVGVALAATLAAVLLPRLPAPARRSEWAGQFALAALLSAVVYQFHQLLQSPPSGWNEWSDDLVDKSAGNLQLYKVGVTAAAALTLITLLASLAARRAWWAIPFSATLVAHLLLGVWMVRSAPTPKIDVFVFQQEGARALLDGRNPYAIQNPDIYAGTPQAADRDVYGQNLSSGGKLAFGFPYPPLSLGLSTLGYRAAADHRYAQVVAFTLAGAFLGFSRPGRWGALAALLLLFTPRAFFILGRAWTEPFVVCLLALTVFCAYRLPRLLPVALGLFLASKQYLVFAVPLAWLLVRDPRDWRAALKLIGGALLVAAAVSAPLILWDLKAFWHSAVTVQQVAPFREDALSWLVWYFHKTGVKPGLWVAFRATVLMLLLALWLCPRTPSGFALGLAAVYLPFIAFNKQAFANYYLFVIAALACALGTLRPERTPAARPPAHESVRP